MQALVWIGRLFIVAEKVEHAALIGAAVVGLGAVGCFFVVRGAARWWKISSQ